MRLVVLHTNDIHGRVEGLGRVATLVERERAAAAGAHVVYVDTGDVEETTTRISNLTKGSAMHRLLSAAGCDAAAVGNAAWLRYGPQVVAEHAAAARYPLLLANLRRSDGALVEGVWSHVVLELAGVRIGLVGVTDPWPPVDRLFGLRSVDPAPLVRELTDALVREDADLVLVLSHLGLAADRELAGRLQGQVSAVIGAHSHDLLPHGEWIGDVLVAQAGQYAEHLGRIELELDGGARVVDVRVDPVPADTPQLDAVLHEERAIEPELDAFLSEVVGELVEPLSHAYDRECGSASFMADVVRERMRADVGLATAGLAFDGPLPAGSLRRGALWEACSSSGNPAAAGMTGAQLRAVVARGLDPELAADTSARALRGRPRGLLHLSGGEVRDGDLLVAGAPVEDGRAYRVAGSDWELEPYGGYVDESWGLEL
ncbi:MAG: 5'-nucleotidase C-terminal domain-containing protein [Actinobacteria bacterium]|nr:5'-nucleotidase C-terminal domain-containing protein [Actinomycetota bacterium]